MLSTFFWYFLVGAIGVAITIVSSLMLERWKKGLGIGGGGILILVSVLLATQALLNTLGMHPEPQTPAAAPSTSPTASANPSTPPTAHSTGTQHGDPNSPLPETTGSRYSPPTIAPTRQDLQLPNAVGKESCAWKGNTGYSWKEDPVNLGGVRHEDGITCHLYNDRQSGWVDFLRPDWSRKLKIFGGIVDDSEVTVYQVRFTVEDAVTGEVIFSEVTALGKPTEHEVQIDGRLRIRLRATVVDGEWRSQTSGSS